MQNLIFFFPGQGAQFPGMGKDLYEKYPEVRHLFSELNDLTNTKWENLIFYGEAETLASTLYSQPAITLINLACSLALECEGITAQAAAGFSLGEFSALYETGILEKSDMLKLVVQRSDIMQRNIENLAKSSKRTGMMAVMGLSPQQIEGLTESLVDVYPANYNSSVQVVLSGTQEALADAELLLKNNGAKRCIPLKVSGPFHSPLMTEASQEFAALLDQLQWHGPQKQFFSSVSGKEEQDPHRIKLLLQEQMTACVQWTSVEKSVLESQLEPMETGPGKVLSSLWKAYTDESNCFPVLDNFKNLLKEPIHV